MAPTDELVALLHEILRDPSRRKELIFRFEKLVNNLPDNQEEDEAAEILGDLAWDFAFYVQDPVVGREDPSYYGDERLEEEIRDALRRLGVAQEP
jgi:hypothetical protein